MVTAPDLARRLRVDPKRLRAWLRAQAAAGHPVLSPHQHLQRWEFSEREAGQLAREFLDGRRGTSAPAHHAAAQRSTPPIRASSPKRVGTDARRGGEAGALDASKPDRSRPATGGDALVLRDKHGAILPLSEDPGHRVKTEWMGQTVLTLEDLLRPGLRAVVAGINPANVSVARGHYWQGRLGRGFLARLRAVGLITEAEPGREDDAAFASGVGFTDLIKSPTRTAKELRPEEYAHGRRALVEKMERYRPPLVIFAFKDGAKAVFGPFSGNGFVAGLQLGPSRVFVMPGPMESNDTALPTLQALMRYLRDGADVGGSPTKKARVKRASA